MNPKFKMLYLVGGTVALVLFIVQVIATYPNINPTGAVLGLLPAIVLFYLAYKAHREKTDGDLM